MRATGQCRCAVLCTGQCSAPHLADGIPGVLRDASSPHTTTSTLQEGAPQLRAAVKRARCWRFQPAVVSGECQVSLKLNNAALQGDGRRGGGRRCRRGQRRRGGGEQAADAGADHPARGAVPGHRRRRLRLLQRPHGRRRDPLLQGERAYEIPKSDRRRLGCYLHICVRVTQQGTEAQ